MGAGFAAVLLLWIGLIKVGEKRPILSRAILQVIWLALLSSQIYDAAQKGDDQRLGFLSAVSALGIGVFAIVVFRLVRRLKISDPKTPAGTTTA